MLRFDNIPPHSPEEVNFTQEAFKEFDAMISYSTAPADDYGRVLGKVVVSNSGESPLNPNFELAVRIVAHLDEQAGSHPVTWAMKRWVENDRVRFIGADNV